LDKHLGKSIEEIKKCYNNEYYEIIDEYIHFLEEKECIFFTNTPERFPPLNLEWDYPHRVSNAIIDCDKESDFDIIDILSQLDNLNCKSIQIRFFCKKDKEEIYYLLDYLKKSQSIIQSVEIYLKESQWTTKGEIEKLLSKYPRIIKLCIYSAKEKEIISLGNKHIIFTDEKISNETHCGVISMNYFSINMKTFSESKNFNSCLNRKISVDKRGNIKNCPSMTKNYGNVKSTTLDETINNSDFKKVWNITKDQIDVCKNCEFRYVCTDCRAYIENPNDKYSKPLKCGYNPNTCEWDDWSKNPLKHKAIENYGLTELIK
jgi:SPASM domain peptide maturase of grasp-with-spasm system